jgi:hypothetical protein
MGVNFRRNCAESDDSAGIVREGNYGSAGLAPFPISFEFRDVAFDFAVLRVTRPGVKRVPVLFYRLNLTQHLPPVMDDAETGTGPGPAGTNG